MQRHFCNLLEHEGKISFDSQENLFQSSDAKVFTNKNDLEGIISSTAEDKTFAAFYELWEFEKLCKYSIPFFMDEVSKEAIIKKLCSSNDVFAPNYILHTSIKDAIPMYRISQDDIVIKFVLQKSYVIPEPYTQVDYRFPVLIYIDVRHKVLEIRYDSTKYTSISGHAKYEKYIYDCIEWIRDQLEIELYACDTRNAIDTIQDSTNRSVVVYRQMMEMSSGGAAELTASKDEDYVLPFIGEIRGLIDENESLFEAAPEIKKILEQYLFDKEATASYPYIYVKWIKPVESHSYIVKITFNYMDDKYVVLQHITGSCNDLGMGRMNNAIKYLCENGAFAKGEKI